MESEAANHLLCNTLDAMGTKYLFQVDALDTIYVAS